MSNGLVIVMAETVRLDVGGMTCDGCSNRVKESLEALSGVVSADVRHEDGVAEISHSGVSRDNLSNAIRSVGYLSLIHI